LGKSPPANPLVLKVLLAECCDYHKAYPDQPPNLIMTEKRGFLAELIHRRVPQIVGLYSAGTWMAIEIAEWASEKLARIENEKGNKTSEQ